MLYALKDNVKITKYGAFEGEDILVLSGAAGENLFGQLVFAGGGERVLSAEMLPFEKNGAKFSPQTEFFWEECVRIRQKSCSYGTEGEVFDILVPFAAALRRENGAFAEEGANGVALVSFVLPRDTAAGEYESAIVVKTDKQQYRMPVKLTVFGFALPKKNHAHSAFAVWYENEKVLNGTPDALPRGEKYETYLKYYELLKKYRVSATELPVRSSHDEDYCAACDANIFGFEARRGILPEDTDNFIAAAKAAAADDEVASYSLPYDVVLTDGVPSVDCEKLYALLVALAKASTNELDLFEKAYFYVTFIDEPSPQQFPLVRSVTESVRETLFKVAKDVDFTGKEKVKRSLLSIDNVVPSWPEEKIYGGVDAWCPTFAGWHAPEFVRGMKNMLDLGSKNWWYGCISPWYPFPTYHLDEPLVGARSEGLLRYLFNVKGNLYWAVNSDRHYDREQNKIIEEDIFDGAFFWKESNGEGVLTFDGSRFGADEPLASLRLAAICMGHQDYEYCLLLDEALKKLNFEYDIDYDAKDYLRPVTEKLFFGTALTDESKFSAVREEYAAAITAAQKGVAVWVGVPSAAEKQAAITVYAPAGAKVRGSGKNISVRPAGRGTAHEFCVDLGKEDVYFTAEIEIAGEKIVCKKLVSPPVVPFDEKNLAPSGDVRTEMRMDGLLCRTEAIDNDRAPYLTLDGAFDLSRLDSFVLQTESYSEDAFSLSVVITDADGKSFNVGYGNVTRGENRLRIHYNPTTQLNGWREVKHTTAFSHFDKAAADSIPDVKNIRQIKIEIQAAREFCALTPRQLRYTGCAFKIKEFYYTEWTDKNPHDYAFLRGGKEVNDERGN